MDGNTPRIRSLLRQADRVADSGKRSAAEKLYRQIIDEAPDTASAYIGLANVVNDSTERENAYRKALEIEPDNEKASQGLNELLGIEEPQESIAVESESPEPAQAIKQEQLEKIGSDSTHSTTQDKDRLDGQNASSSPEFAHDLSLHDHSEYQLEEVNEVLFCANHPSRKTHLRCNKCGKPICSSCAQPTPVGYRCPECIREQEDIFYTATALDYLMVILVTVPLSLLGGWLATLIGFFTIFLGAGAGTLIGRIAFRAAGRRRGRGMPQLVAVLLVIGGLLPVLPILLFGGINFRLLWSGIYIFTATGAAYYQMR